MPNILFIDDDLDILAINKKYYTKEGHNVKTASNPKSAIELLKTFSPDCIILDIMMPIQNGFETCQQIRSISNSPIIFLSGRSGENDKVKGLLTGADDYMVKPYSFRELSARIQAQIRRNSKSIDSSIINYPPLTLNLVLHKAYCRNEEILLSNREFELLYLLVSNAKKVVTFQDIGIHMWNTYSESDRSTIMVTASRLRNKLEPYLELSNMIQSVRSKGYVFD